MTDLKPVGSLTVVGASQRQTANRIAAYAQVHIKDEAGNLWFFDAAAFSFDMKPLPEEQAKQYSC